MEKRLRTLVLILVASVVGIALLNWHCSFTFDIGGHSWQGAVKKSDK